MGRHCRQRHSRAEQQHVEARDRQSAFSLLPLRRRGVPRRRCVFVCAASAVDPSIHSKAAATDSVCAAGRVVNLRCINYIVALSLPSALVAGYGSAKRGR